MTTLDLHTFFKKHSSDENNKNKDSELFPILTDKELLAEPSFDFTIKDIKQHLVIPEDAFEDIYISVINNYAKFIQSLPSIKHSNFGFNKGQLLLSILRANLALETADNYPCPSLNRQLTPQEEEKRYAVWQFAIFSSSLLLDIGSAISSLDIITCSNGFENSTYWTPLDGDMTINNNHNTHYFYKLIGQQEKAYNQKLNLLFARMIIPNYIFSWLSSEQDIFFEWLSLLEDEAGGSGTLHSLTIVNLRRLINEYMGFNQPRDTLKLLPSHIEKKQSYHKNSFWKGVEHSLRGEKSLPVQTTTPNYGLEFIKWLKDGITNKSISVNEKDSQVHISDEGVFLIHPEIFIQFSNQSPKYQNWQLVFRQFNQLGITKYSNQSNIYEKHFPNVEGAKASRGLIIEDPKIIFGQEKVPSLSTQLSLDTTVPIKDSTVFPTPREEVGSYLRHIFRPKPEGS